MFTARRIYIFVSLSTSRKNSDHRQNSTIKKNPVCVACVEAFARRVIIILPTHDRASL